MGLEIAISAMPATDDDIDYVVEAERLGVDSVWVPELWGYDAFTLLGALARATERIALGTGIVQIGPRTPALLAMASAALHSLSDGRFRLGLGTSGPQVIEGWHGVRFDKPVTRTRETIEIVRLTLSGERLEYDGEFHQLPLPDSEGRALRLAGPSVDLPIYLASLGPRNLRLTGEMCDGWLGTSFLVEHAPVFFDEIEAGAHAAGRSLSDLDLMTACALEFTDDLDEAGRRHAAGYAFTIGAMGSSSTNFYNRAFGRQGFADQVAEVERLWRSGDRDAARAAVPIEIGIGTNLLGNDDQIRDRLRLLAAAGITSIRVGPQGETHHERLDNLGRFLDLVRDLDKETP